MIVRRTLAAASVLVLFAGCRVRPSAKKTDADAAPPAVASPSLGGGLGMLGAVLASQSDEPGPYDDPRKSPGYAGDKAHAVILHVDDAVVELRSFSLLGARSGIELRTLTDKLAEVAADPQTTALVLRFGDVDIDFPAAEELRAAMAAFRRHAPAGRPIHCHADHASNVVYYVMSGCDSIGLAPVGELIVSGVAAVPIHVKGALDLIGVEADFLHVGAFKGAAEPLTRTEPSAEMRETLSAILDERYGVLVDGIAEGRRLDKARVRALIDSAVFDSRAALAGRLVDKVAVFEEWRAAVLADLSWRVDPLEDEKPGMARIVEMLGVVPRRRPTDPHVALVYAVGSVVDGEGGGPVAARREIASQTLGAALRALAADDSVKAIVLRIDSGGGSALASEILWQGVAAARKKKPVVISMGGVAASGGYYIGCGANAVFASRTTLTGSIGVVGGKLAVGRGLGRVGVTAYPMGRGKRALLWSSLAPWTVDERAAVQKLMEDVYSTFVARVAEGRGKPRASVHAVAQGRVWTGAAARDKGLVDRIGGLEDALDEAHRLAKLDRGGTLEVYPPPPTLMDWLGSLGGAAMPLGLDAAAAAAARLMDPREAAAVLALFDQVASFSTTHVQTAMILPVALR